MTDLPQLEALLVDAAVKHRRRRRVRRAAAPALALALLLFTLPWLLGDLRTPDREEPVATPEALGVEQAFSVLRRPAARADVIGDSQPGDVVRKLGSRQTKGAYLLLRGDQLCLIVQNRYECGRAADYVAGHRVLATVVDDSVYALVPDGVPTVLRTWYTRASTPYAVLNNLVTFKAPTGSGSIAWVAPDGTHANTRLRDFTNPRMWYPRLGMPETETDREAGFPGARALVNDSEGRIQAWLVPRRNAICLLARVAGEEHSVCRRPVAVSKPLVLSIDAHPQRILVLAFQSWQQPEAVIPASAQRRITPDAILILDGDDARKVRVRYSGVRDERVVDTLPEPGAFLTKFDRAISPSALSAR